MGKGTIVRTAVITLTILAGLIGSAGHSLASFGQDQKLTKGKFAIDALVTHATVRRGDEEEVELATIPKANVLITVKYPTKGGFHTKGKTDKTGYWQHKWEVHADYPGTGSAVLEIIKNNQRRYYTVHFTVASSSATTVTVTVPPVTSTAGTVTVTPTATGSVSVVPGTTTTATTTVTTTATPTDTPTSTPTPTATATLSATPTATTTTTSSTSATCAGTSIAEPTSFDLTNDAQGLNQVNYFSNSDTVYAQVQYDNVSGAPSVSFNWYGPGGDTPYSTSQEIDETTQGAAAPNQSDLFYGNLLLASAPPGTWYVQLVVNGCPEAEQKFYVNEGSDPGSNTSNVVGPSSIQFYSATSVGGPSGQPQTSFSLSSTHTVYAYMTFPTWVGSNTVFVNWTDPNGQFDTAHSYAFTATDTNALTVMVPFDVAGLQTGTWTLTVTSTAAQSTGTFTLTS